MKRLLLAAALLLLGALGSSAQISHCPTINAYPFTANCPISTEQLNEAIANAGNSVSAINFGADPTGVADSSSAINAAADTVVNGEAANVRLPAGSYRVLSQLNIKNGQCLIGDGVGNTNLLINTDFDPDAPGVVFFSGREQLGPCIRDINFSFTQPLTQSSRAAFKTLTQGCTATSGCKYPPAINLGDSNRFKISNIRVSNGWDGIIHDAVTFTSGSGGFVIENIEMGTLNIGMNLDDIRDGGFVDNFHLFNYGFGAATPLYSVYEDGDTICARFGRFDGTQVNNIRCFIGKMEMTADFTFGQFSNLKLDSAQATLSVAGSVAGLGLQISGLAKSVANTDCAINFTDQASTVDISGFVVTNAAAAPTSSSLICVNATGAKISMVSGSARLVKTDARLATVTSGSLYMRGAAINFVGGPWTTPVISVGSSGRLVFQDNNFLVASTADVGAVTFASDSNLNMVSGNNWNGWKVGLLFAGASCFGNGTGDCDWSTALNPTGYYDLGGAPFHMAVTPTFATPGDVALTNVALTGAYWELLGDFVDFSFRSEFDITHTTAAGSFMVTTNMPLPITATNRACSLFGLQKFTITAGEIMTLCVTDIVGTAAVVELISTISGAGAMVTYTTANLPTGRTDVVVGASGRFRTR